MASQESMENTMGGWIGFAGLVMIIVGAIGVIQGFFAIIEDEKIVATGKGLAIIDVTAWGWLTLLWGIALVLVGLALLGGQGWARWVAIIGVAIGAIQQMAFLANYPQAFPLWEITILALYIIVLFALTARWQGYKNAMSGV